MSSVETRHSGDPWGQDPPRTAYAAANLMMTSVPDDLAGLRQLLDDNMSLIAPTVVARSAIEIASRAWWLMEPGIGARRRVRRELVLSLTSAHRTGQVAEEFQAGASRRAEKLPTRAGEKPGFCSGSLTWASRCPRGATRRRSRTSPRASYDRDCDCRDAQVSPGALRSGHLRLPHVLSRDTRRDLR